jgi:predicted metal-dependent peptidase
MTVMVTPKQKTAIDRAKVRLLIAFPFYSSLLLHLNERPTEEIPTLAVDGTNLFYNPSYIESLTREELMSAMCHETLHLALLHLKRVGSRERDRWNHATDYAINALIKQDNMPIKDEWLHDRQYYNKSAEVIYEELPEGTGKGGTVGENGGTQDDHSVWEDGLGDDDAQDGDGQGQAQGQAKFDPAMWKNRVAQAATAARIRGLMPAHMESFVNDLLHPVLDWRVLLRDFIQTAVKSNYRLFPPNKRFIHIPMYLPSMYGEEVEIAVAIDTSGSVSDEELQTFVSEVRGVTEQFEGFRIHIIQCDAEVNNYALLTAYEGEIPNKIYGRGGTRFEPPFEYAEEHDLQFSCLIYFTDGYGSFPEEPMYPTLWVMTSDVEAPFGMTIKYQRETKYSN